MNQQEALDSMAHIYVNQQRDYIRNQGLVGMSNACNVFPNGSPLAQLMGNSASYQSQGDLTNITPSPAVRLRNNAQKYAAEVRARNPSMQVKRQSKDA